MTCQMRKLLNLLQEGSGVYSVLALGVIAAANRGFVLVGV
jgi:hypothetical protein